jgi:hypothetical protein
MYRPDDRLESLISRRLDGELSDTESLELDKWLIRDAEARRCYEELARIDLLASEVLSSACAERSEVFSDGVRPTRILRRSAWWGLISMAAAACLALVLIWPAQTPRDPTHDTLARNPAVSHPGVNTPNSDPFSKPSVQLANYPAEPVRQSGTKVDYYGIFDEGQEKLYLLEVKQTTSRQHNDRRTVSTPQGKVMLTSGEM